MSRSPLFIIFLVVFIDLLGFGIVLPLLPRYGEHFAASKMTLGALMASFSAMQFVFAPLWGRLSDRIGRRPVLLIGLAGSAVSYFFFARITQMGAAGSIYGLSPLFWLFVTRIGAGIAGATIPTAQAYIADVTDSSNRGKGMAIIGFAFGIGFTFGPLLGSFFVPWNADPAGDTAPSAAPGYVAAILSAAAFVCAVVMLPESLKKGASAAAVSHGFSLQSLKTAMLRPYISQLMLAIFLTTFAFAQFETTLSTLTKALGMGPRINFYVFAYIGLILSLAQGFLVRRLIPRVGEFWMGFCGVIGMAGGLLLLGFASQQASVAWMYACLPIAVVGFAATTPSLQALLSLNIDEHEQGGMLGVGQSMSALARILGPLLALPLQGMNLSLPYWTGAGLMAVALGLVITLRGATYAQHPRTV